MPSDITKYEGPDMAKELTLLGGVAHMKGRRLSDEDSDAAVRLIAADVHPKSARPCETCRKVSAILGEPFWCLEYAIEQERRERREGEFYTCR